MGAWTCCLQRSATTAAECCPTSPPGNINPASSDTLAVLRARPPRLPRPVRGLLMELGGVLYDDTLWSRWLVRLLTHLGLNTSYRCFIRLWQREYLCEVQAGRCDFCEAFASFLRSAGLSRGQIDEVAAACRTRREELETSIRLLPTVSKTLWELARRGLPLGIACNTTSPRETVTTRLQNLEIEGCFRALATSIEARASMPDPACYLAALDQLRLAPGEVAMVAHDTAVMAGAAALGMQVVAFNFDPDAEADLYLSRFDDLLTAVDLRQPLAAAG